MNISDILFAAGFCMSVVFAMLAALYALLKLSTGAIRFIEAKTKRRREG